MMFSRVTYSCLIFGILSVTGLAQVNRFSVQASGGGTIAAQSAGIPLFIQITALDSLNAIVTSFGGTVEITSTGTLVAGGGTTRTFVNGVLNPDTVTFSNTGTFSITATRTAGTETGTSNLFTVNPGAATTVRVETLPSGTGGIVPLQNVVAGNQLQVYAVTRDTFNNFIANVAADSWTLQSITGAVLAGDLVPALDLKSAVFTGHKTGTAVIRATSGTVPATASGTITVTAGSLDNFFVESSAGGNIPGQGAGVPFSIKVTARDTFGNTVPGFGGNVGITSTGTLSAGSGTTAAFTNGVLSSHSVTISSLGTFSITATRTAGTEAGTSNLFTVTTGPARSVRVETLPNGTGTLVPPQSVVAGNQLQVYAVTRDTFNNFIANVAADSWTLQSITGGVLAGDLVPAVDLKSAAFTGHKTGTAVIRATSGAVPATSSGTVTVTAGPLDNFFVESSAGGNIPAQAAGVPFSIKVTARDTFGNTVPGFAGNVGITSTGTLSAGGGTTGAFTNGVLNPYSVTFSNTGTFSITATRTAGTETGTSNLFTVTTGPAKSVRVETLPNGNGTLVPPQNVVAGNQLQVYAVTRDTFNNFIANVAADSWALQGITGGGLAGDLVPAVDLKSAVFTGHKTGTAVIRATSGAVPATASGTLTVTPGPLGTFLVESSAGGNIPTQTLGIPFSIRIAARDSFGNGTPGFTGTVDMTSTGTLSGGGGTTPPFTNGVLSSYSVTVANAGNFKLTATQTGGAINGSSNTFTVNNPLPSSTGISPPARVKGGAGFTLTVNGSSFVPSSVVNFAGSSRTTTFINSTQISAAILPGDLATAGTFAVTVFNPLPGGGTSNPQTFTVKSTVAKLKVFLQGCYTGGSMRTTLRDKGLIPLSQPYGSAPYNYPGTEAVTSIPPGVVDWLLLEIRSGSSGATKVATRAAFLKSNGTVVDTDGISPVMLANVGVGNYYIVVSHRNHLAVMSASALTLTDSTVLFDFTTGIAQYFGGDAKNVGGGVFALYAGDYSENGFIDIDDFVGPDNEVFQSGYRRSDLNMDGFVDSGDFIDPDNNLFKGTRVLK